MNEIKPCPGSADAPILKVDVLKRLCKREKAAVPDLTTLRLDGLPHNRTINPRDCRSAPIIHAPFSRLQTRFTSVACSTKVDEDAAKLRLAPTLDHFGHLIVFARRHAM